jgi:transposase-like protein
MVRNIPLACPHCQKAEPVIKHGTSRAGTQRYRCLDCNKTFAKTPKSRQLSPQIQDAIQRALAERMSKNAIKRTFKVAWNTIDNIEKKYTPVENPH